MSTSWRAQGIRLPDERWQQMKAVYDACTAAGIDVPDEVMRFFNYEGPDPAGVVIDIPSREWKSDYYSGTEVDVADIPDGVRTIRFVISW